MKKRLLASLLSLCLLVGLLPTAALAVDEAQDGETPAVCAELDGCIEDAHDEGCPLYVTPEGPVNEPEGEPEEPAGPTAEEQLAALIAALPAPADIDPLDEAQVKAVYDQLTAIHAFAEENGMDVEDDEIINAVIAAAWPAEPLGDPAPAADATLSGNCGAAGSESSVTWELTKNSDGDTYTLTISGTGAMKAYTKTDPVPWSEFTTKITSVVINEGVTSIGALAFSGFSALTQISLPSTLTTITVGALENCTALTAISLPASLELNDTNPFRRTGITNFYVAEGSSYISGGAILYTKTDDNTLTLVSAPTASGNFTIPSSVNDMTVTSIGKEALFGNLSLTGIVIPASITSVSESGYQFSQCTNLASVTLSESLTAIPARMFFNAPITIVSIPKSVTSIGDNAFGCSSGKGKLEEVKIEGNIATLHANAFQNQTVKTLIFGPGVTSVIGNSFGKWSALSTVKFEGSGSITINENAFYDHGTSGTTTQAPITGMDMSSVSSVTFAKTGDNGDKARAFNGWEENSAIYVGSDSVANTIMENSTNGDSNKHQISTEKTCVIVVNGGKVDLTKSGFGAVTKEGYIANWYENSNFSGSSVTTTAPGKIYYAKWIELTANDISMEYGSKKALSDITISGVTLTGWTSADNNVVKVENDKLVATGVGKTTITANASLTRSGEKLTVDVEVTPMPITFGSDKNPGGTITYAFTGMAPEFSQFATFYPAKVEDGSVSVVPDSSTITLTEGKDIVFIYNAGGGENEYDYLPVNVTSGDYGIEVTVKLINDNYRFVTTSNQTLSDTIKENVIVKADNMTEVPIAGLPAIGEDLSYAYTGAGIAPIGNLTRISAGSINKFTVHFHPWGDTEFEEQHLENMAAGDLTPTAIQAIAPEEPGSYLMIVDGKNESEYVYQSWIYTITKATVTITPVNKTAYVGDAVPTLGPDDYTVTGLVGNDTLTNKPTLAYDGAPDMSKADTYTIKASGAAADEAHYTLVYQDGTLTVRTRSSGGGGGSSSTGSTGNVTGSGDDVNIDVSGSSVTAAQMEKAVNRADRGETITIEVSGRSSVSLPSSGLQDAADNNNDVTVELKNGEVTLSPEALSAVADQAGTTVTLTVEPVDTDELNRRQQATVGDAPVFDLTIKSGGRTITDFDGGLVTVAIPYELPDGQDPAGVVVWFMDDNGNITACETMYDLRTEMVIFTTRHFSKYVIGYEAPMNFTDVSANAYYADAVEWAVANGITSGTGDGTTFSPDMSCTRAQMVTFLWRAAGSPVVNYAMSFTDVPTDAYYAEAVRWALSQGITAGTGDGSTFSPDAVLTRGQTVTFLWRANGSPAVSGASFADVDANAYYADAVAWAVREGITSGTGNNTFSPDAACTRCQIVTFMFRSAN